jgi:CheY-like chemotaxis protein
MLVTEASTGQDALAYLETADVNQESFSLAILDLHMPAMDGLMLARSIRGRPKDHNLAILMLASFRDRALASEAKGLGVAAYLVKPVRHASLVIAIRQALGVGGGGRVKTVASATLLGSQYPQKQWRILLAEDNVVNQRVTALILKRFGCHVDVVRNGQEAYDALRKISYDLILMDCQMPEMDGFSATQAIRALEGTQRHTPIIALTANALKGERERCLEAGMDAYLAKPVTSEALSAALELWLPKATHLDESGQ